MELWDIYDRQRRTTGRFHVRGTPMGRGEYHLTAFVWVFNRQRELLMEDGVPFLPDGRVDLAQSMWWGDDAQS